MNDADPLALELLEQGLSHVPNDPEAWLARGRVLRRMGRPSESLDSFRQGLILRTGKESLLHEAASQAMELEETSVALPLLDRLLAVNRWRADYHHLHALALAQARKWKAAAEACRASLALLNACNIEVRLTLIRSLLEAGDPAAEAELTTMLRGNPPDAEGLRRWFAEQKRH